MGELNKLARSAVGKIITAALNRTEADAEGKAFIEDYMTNVIVALNNQLPASGKVFVDED